ncbi:hypothetical protein D9758_008917 [Tetrapyrgos nigripes]|uniref:Uncharacterized protein n=1 Tax=Tetrapyrgos nigripes TaxID=182062 RepID=A0A8H5LRC7_9AGAR|nr:hypothetical protein D9758_008917 [Tetrapyrgos nigripes]
MDRKERRRLRYGGSRLGIRIASVYGQGKGMGMMDMVMVTGLEVWVQPEVLILKVKVRKGQGHGRQHSRGGGSRDWGVGMLANVTRRNGTRRSEVYIRVCYGNVDDYALEEMDDDEVLGLYDWRTGRVDGNEKKRKGTEKSICPRWVESEEVQNRNSGVVDHPQTPLPCVSEINEYKESSNPHLHLHGKLPSSRAAHGQRHELKVKKKPFALRPTRLPHHHAENGYNGDILRTSTPPVHLLLFLIHLFLHIFRVPLAPSQGQHR